MGPVVFSQRTSPQGDQGRRIGLERAFGEHVVLSTRWSKTRNYSNVEVFDYSRDVFGLSVRVGLGG